MWQRKRGVLMTGGEVNSLREGLMDIPSQFHTNGFGGEEINIGLLTPPFDTQYIEKDEYLGF